VAGAALISLACWQGCAPGSADTQARTPELRFIVQTKTNLAHLGSRVQLTSMDEETADAYFAELDRLPPATRTEVDTGYVILVEGSARVGVVPVHNGSVCGHYSIAARMHQAILRALGQAEGHRIPEPRFAPGLDT
jgi:hypothetical protein